MRLVVVVVAVNAVLVCRGPIYVLIFNMTSAARSVSVYPPRGVCGCFDRLLFKLYVQYLLECCKYKNVLAQLK